MAGGHTERRRHETRRRRRGIRGGLRGRGAVGLDKIGVTRPLFDQVHEAVMEDKAFLEARQEGASP